MSSASDPKDTLQTWVGDFHAWYHIPALIGIILFMFWSRVRSWTNFRGGEDEWYLAAVDSYYHWRTTQFTIDHWPLTMPYEVWTSWPYGRTVGQFGTAFDQLIATFALIVGLGDPSVTQTHRLVLFAIPLLGALVAIPVYVIGKRFGGRPAGLGAAGVLALFPGTFYVRSLAGQFDHHVAEVLFMGIAIAAFLRAVEIAQTQKPVYEQVLDRDLSGLKPTILASSLAGVALAIYQWMWPPGVLLIGILAVYFGLFLMVQYWRGQSPEHLAFVGAISMPVAAVLVLARIEEISSSPTGFGYLGPVLAIGIAVACIFMGWLARQWDDREMARWTYPAAVVLGAGIGAIVLAVVLPDVLDRVIGDFQNRVFPFASRAGERTIQEARPPRDYTGKAYREFGLAFYTALLGLGGLLTTVILATKGRAEHALVVVWGVFLLSLSTNQGRFFYYLVLFVAVGNAWVIGQVVDWADLREVVSGESTVQAYQILIIATLVLVLAVPLLPPMADGLTVVEGESGPHTATLQWEESLDYLETATPAEGEWGGQNDELAYYGRFALPEDGDFDYPDGAYGVMSWWDYGHLITVEGERIPHANPFQAGARSSSAYFLANNETRSNLILDALPSGETVVGASNEDLQEMVAGLNGQERGEGTRYIMIDSAMVMGKFQAITVWSGREMNRYVSSGEVTIDGETVRLPRMNENYFDTTMVSLYMGDGRGMSHYRLVHESSELTAAGSVAQRTQNGQWQPALVNRDLSRLGISPLQLQQSPNFHLYDVRSDLARVKTFERVPGATLTGTSDAEPGTRVQAALRLQANTSERNFTYTQRTTVQANGSWAVTVPYATSEDLGTEDGYTETVVRARGEYDILVGDNITAIEETATASVPEEAIYEGREITIQLESTDDSSVEEAEGAA